MKLGRARVPTFLRHPITWLLVIVVIASAYLTYLSARGNGDQPFLDDPSEQGGLAFRRLTEQYNVNLERTAHPKQGSTVLVMSSTSLGSADLAEFVKQGGTVVAAGRFPAELDVKDIRDDARNNPVLQPQCNASWAQGVGSVRVASSRTYPVMKASESDVGCFPSGTSTYFAVEKHVGLGRMILLTTDQMFTNELIGEQDNAVLVANLIGAQGGGTLQILDPSVDPGNDANFSDKSLLEVVPAAFYMAMLQVVVVFVVLALNRGRRFGRLVTEDLPVKLPASALVVAQGELMDTAGQTNATAAVLRSDVRRKVALLVGADPTLDADSLVATVESRTGIEPRRLRYVLVDSPVSNGSQLLALSQEIERLHQEVVNVR